ncbi:MAG: hypothetical protein Kow0032_27040 [Methyloligellaceae bacterium]
MTRAALSVYMYGMYLVTGVGLPFLIIPHFTLGLFGMSAGDDMWIRFVGVLSGMIGGFYIAAVLTHTHRFFAWTVPARYLSATFMATMVVLGKVGIALLMFAALDALTGSITWLAIRADAEDGKAAGGAAASS